MTDDDFFPEEPPFAEPLIEERLKKVLDALLKNAGAKVTECKKNKGSKTAICKIQTMDGKQGTIDVELGENSSEIKIRLPKSPKIDIQQFRESEF